MATIAGTLLLGSGAPAKSTYIRVRMASPPFDGAGVVRSGMPQLFVTHATTGAYSFTLSQGSYRVNIPATPEFEITVPSGSGTYPLEGVVGSSAPVSLGEYPYYDTVAEAALEIILGSRVDVLADGNTVPGPATFYRGEGPDYANDGINGFADFAGTKFTRMRRE